MEQRSDGPADLATLIQAADRRTLAAVVTHLTADAGAVPDLRDKPQIQALALDVLPAFLRGERSPEVPDDEVLQAAMDLAVGQAVPAFVQSLPGFDNWYRGDRDRVTTIAPKSILRFWQDCRAPDPDAYSYR